MSPPVGESSEPLPGLESVPGVAARVSVIMPCHNAAETMEESVQSALMQQADCAGLEIILVDDHSSDGTAQLMRSLEARHPDVIRCVTHEGVRGPGAARNSGVAVATMPWLAFLDGDDVMLPGSIRERFRGVEAFPDALFVGADFYEWEGGTYHESDLIPFYETRPQGAVVLAEALRTREPVQLRHPLPDFAKAVLAWTGSVLIRRDAFEMVGGFDESLWRFEDDHLWLRLSAIYGYVWVPSAVTLYRQRVGSLTRRDSPPGYWGIQAYKRLFRCIGFRGQRLAYIRALARFYDEDQHFYRTHRMYLPSVKAALGALLWWPFSFTRYRSLVASLLGL